MASENMCSSVFSDFMCMTMTSLESSDSTACLRVGVSVRPGGWTDRQQE